MEDSLRAILEQEKLGHHVDLFIENGIVDIEVFRTLDLADLKVRSSISIAHVTVFAIWHPASLFFSFFVFLFLFSFFKTKEKKTSSALLCFVTFYALGYGSNGFGGSEKSHAGH